MAQTNFTPILLYASGTPTNVPSAGNLTSSASGAELALNYADGKLFYKDSGGNVQTLASKATGSIGGSNTQVQYNSSGALAGSANLTFNGTTLTVADLTDSSLTSGRVTYATTGGNLTDSANLTFNGTTLTANALTVSTGNLAFSSTAQRITGDFTNATLANRLAFQTSTANSATGLLVLPSGTSQISQVQCFNNSDPTNAARLQLAIGNTEAQVLSSITGTGTYLPMTFYTGGSEAMRIDTSRRVGIGGSPSVGGVQLTILGGGTQLSPGTTAQEGLRVQRATGFATLTGINNDNNAYNGLQFFTGASAAATIDTSGNVAVGTTNAGTAGLSLSQNYNLSWEQSATESVPNLFRQTSSAALVMSVGYKRSATANGFASSFGSSLAKTAISLGTTTGAITFYTDTAATTAVGTDVTPTERMRIDSSGNVGIGTASPGALLDVTGNDPSIRLTDNAGGTPTTWSMRSGDGNYVIRNITAGVDYLSISATGGITSANLADAVGYKGTPLNEQSTAYTLVIGDMGKSIVHPISDNNPRTFTIPANGSVAYPVGTAITFVNMINTVTIAINTDTMYLAGAGTTGSRTLAAYGVATAIKVTSTSWIISGNGLT